MVRITRAEMDRSLNMGKPELRRDEEFGRSQIMFNNFRLSYRAAVLRAARPWSDRQRWECFSDRAPTKPLILPRYLSPRPDQARGMSGRSCGYALFAVEPGSDARIILP